MVTVIQNKIGIAISLYKCEKPMNHRVCKEGYSSNPSICVLVIMTTL